MSARSGHLANRPRPTPRPGSCGRPSRAGSTRPSWRGWPSRCGATWPRPSPRGRPCTPRPGCRCAARSRSARWLPFRARQVLAPRRGFVWTARAAGLIAGVDRYADGAGMADWKLAGLVTVAHGEGPDTSRSAAARAGAEGIWLPTALLPRLGVRWAAPAADWVTADFGVGETPLELELRLDPAGRVVALRFDRWGDPGDGGGYAWHPFGGEITGYASFAGLTIPSAGRLGWFWGTDRWAEGEFFRYEITGLQPVGSR